MSWKGKLLACGNNAKTVKGDGSEYLTAIMYMRPWKADEAYRPSLRQFDR